MKLERHELDPGWKHASEMLGDPLIMVLRRASTYFLQSLRRLKGQGFSKVLFSSRYLRWARFDVQLFVSSTQR